MERTTAAFSHKLMCTPQEEYQMRCLNGGTCFAIMVENSNRKAGCRCMPNRRGFHCEYEYIDMLAVQQENLRTANIAAGVSVCILFVFVVLLIIYVYLRIKRRRRQEREQRHEFANGQQQQPGDNNNSAPSKDNDVNKALLKKEAEVAAAAGDAGEVRNGAGSRDTVMIGMDVLSTRPTEKL